MENTNLSILQVDKINSTRVYNTIAYKEINGVLGLYDIFDNLIATLDNIAPIQQFLEYYYKTDDEFDLILDEKYPNSTEEYNTYINTLSDLGDSDSFKIVINKEDEPGLPNFVYNYSILEKFHKVVNYSNLDNRNITIDENKESAIVIKQKNSDNIYKNYIKGSSIYRMQVDKDSLLFEDISVVPKFLPYQEIEKVKESTYNVTKDEYTLVQYINPRIYGADICIMKLYMNDEIIYEYSGDERFKVHDFDYINNNLNVVASNYDTKLTKYTNLVNYIFDTTSTSGIVLEIPYENDEFDITDIQSVSLLALTDYIDIYAIHCFKGTYGTLGYYEFNKETKTLNKFKELEVSNDTFYMDENFTLVNLTSKYFLEMDDSYGFNKVLLFFNNNLSNLSVQPLDNNYYTILYKEELSAFVKGKIICTDILLADNFQEVENDYMYYNINMIDTIELEDEVLLDKQIHLKMFADIFKEEFSLSKISDNAFSGKLLYAIPIPLDEIEYIYYDNSITLNGEKPVHVNYGSQTEQERINKIVKSIHYFKDDYTYSNRIVLNLNISNNILDANVNDRLYTKTRKEILVDTVDCIPDDSLIVEQNNLSVI